MTATALPGSANIGAATVTWQPPATDGGSPIIQYVVTPMIGNSQQTATIVTSSGPPGSPPPTTATVTPLANRTTYTFIVQAVNAVGPGVPSQPSNPITPLAPATPNNTGTTPVNLGAVACGGNITRDGDDNRAGTHAWYTVTFNQSLLPPCTLGIDLTGSADLFAVHSGTFDGPLVTTSGPVSSFRTTTGGTYFIDVSGGVDGVPFSLQITTH